MISLHDLLVLVGVILFVEVSWIIEDRLIWHIGRKAVSKRDSGVDSESEK